MLEACYHQSEFIFNSNKQVTLHLSIYRNENTSDKRTKRRRKKNVLIGVYCYTIHRILVFWLFLSIFSEFMLIEDSRYSRKQMVPTIRRFNLPTIKSTQNEKTCIFLYGPLLHWIHSQFWAVHSKRNVTLREFNGQFMQIKINYAGFVSPISCAFRLYTIPN